MVEYDLLLGVNSEGFAIGKVGEVVCRVGRFTAWETLEELESIGYEVQIFIIPACAVDAKHRRDRIFILCYSEHYGSLASENRRTNKKPQEQTRKDEKRESEGASSLSPVISNSIGQRGCGGDSGWQCAGYVRQLPGSQRNDTGGMGRWLPEPSVGRVAHGIPNRVDRLKQLGNSVVPQVVAVIGRAILEAEK